MFTGLVEELGKIKSITKGTKSARLTIEGQVVLQDVKLGDSIAVNGTCLTVVEYTQRSFTADVMPETVRSTVLAELKPGDVVNLERTLRLGDRLGGHIVSGHVDGVGEVDAFEKVAESYRLVVRCPMKLAKFLAYKGSVAINGVSLTINEVEDTPAGTRISINLIPHTFEHTSFKYTKKRDLVNVEVDTVARYIERMYSLTEHK